MGPRNDVIITMMYDARIQSNRSSCHWFPGRLTVVSWTWNLLFWWIYYLCQEYWQCPSCFAPWVRLAHLILISWSTLALMRRETSSLSIRHMTGIQLSKQSAGGNDSMRTRKTESLRLNASRCIISRCTGVSKEMVLSNYEKIKRDIILCWVQ